MHIFRIFSVIKHLRIRHLGVLGWLCLGITSSHAGPKAVGKISFARGSNAAQQPGAAPRILGQDADIFQGDNIQTTERSFVIIAFNDGAKVTVRPNSNFTVDHYDQQSAHPHAQLTLHEGGVRASSGEIAKQTPESFQIKTPLATIKAQQADYSIRLCQQDCGEEVKPVQKASIKTDQSVVARIVDVKGQVMAKNQQDKNAKERPLALGAPLYSADYLRSQNDSYALMVFRDGEKITLQANSEMAIADYGYKRDGEQDHALYRLTIGGMRALTGSIGKTNKSAFAVDTPVGTIGIRGTGFDLSCVGSCVNRQKPEKDRVQKGVAEGLYSQVWQGQIVLKNERGEQVMTMPESAYFANRQTELWKLPEFPSAIPNNMVPRPDADHSSLEKLFARQSQKGVPSGLYVTVHNGHVQLKQEGGKAKEGASVDLGKDEVAYANPQKEVARLVEQQGFQTDDVYPLPSQVDGQKPNGGIYSMLTDPDEANAGAASCKAGE